MLYDGHNPLSSQALKPPSAASHSKIPQLLEWVDYVQSTIFGRTADACHAKDDTDLDQSTIFSRDCDPYSVHLADARNPQISPILFSCKRHDVSICESISRASLARRMIPMVACYSTQTQTHAWALQQKRKTQLFLDPACMMDEGPICTPGHYRTDSAQPRIIP